MTRMLIAAFTLLGFVALACAQNAPQVFYAESFRQGPTHVTEQNLEVKLDAQNRNYRERIKDSRGSDRYVLTLKPQGPEGDSNITSWQARLADLHHSIYDNILLASQDPSSGDAKNGLWRLEPGKFSAVPIEARRIIKVDGFYVTLQVKAYHFTPLDSPYLDSMTVDVKFSNADPRGSP